MAKMMMGQIDHARNRVRNIKNRLIGKAPEAAKTFSIHDLVAGLRDGTVKFSGPQLQKFAQEWADAYTKNTNSYCKPSFESIVLENAFKVERDADAARYKAENDVYQDLCKRVNEKATEVEDAIVLGDQHAALIALQEFAAFKP